MDIDIDKMSNDQLKALRKQRYQEAIDNGTIGRIGMVCRYLGQKVPAKYGPKYLWDCGKINVYVDDYGHYMTASVDGKTILSTHSCDQFIIPGPAIDKILEFYPESDKKRTEKKDGFYQAEREKLLSQIL